MQEEEWRGGRKKEREKEREEEIRTDRETGKGDRDTLVLSFFLPSILLVSGPGYKQGNMGDVVYRVQRVPGKCSLQDLLVEETGETGK